MVAARKQKKVVEWDPIRNGGPLWSFDVSSSAIGWCQFFAGQVNDFGVIKSPASWDSRKRIAANTEKLSDMIYERRPLIGGSSRAAMEWNSHKTTRINAQGLAVLGQSQGAVWHMLLVHPEIGLVDQVSERDWTKQGGKNIQKITRQRQACLLCPEYGLMIRDDPNYDPGLDASDAIGLGFWRLSIR